MTLHVLVEGPSEREFFERWIPRILRGVELRVHAHQGKGELPSDWNAAPDRTERTLLHQLPAKLRGFRSSLGDDDAVLVVVDADDSDPEALLAKLTALPWQPAKARYRAALAVEELEAFYLGDQAAIRRAFPAAQLHKARDYLPDAVCGTWELFGRVIGDGGGNKVSWAEKMGRFVTVVAGRNRSPSFKVLVKELQAIGAPRSKLPPKPRKYRHPKARRNDPSGRR